MLLKADVLQSTETKSPIIKPPLYTKPDALFLIVVGNLSDRKAGIAPNAVEATNTSNAVNNIL